MGLAGKRGLSALAWAGGHGVRAAGAHSAVMSKPVGQAPFGERVGVVVGDRDVGLAWVSGAYGGNE